MPASPIMALPPAFRSFYSTTFSTVSTDKTINVMQDKKYLLNKAQTPAVTGVLVDSVLAGGSVFAVSTSSSTITITSGSLGLHVGMRVEQSSIRGLILSVTGTEGTSVTAFVLGNIDGSGAEINGWTDATVACDFDYPSSTFVNKIPVDTVDATTKFEAGDIVFDNAGVVTGFVESVTANIITITGSTLTSLADNENLKSIPNNEITTEYSHVSNILEWIQSGGNPYWACGVVALGRYDVENSSNIKVPIGGQAKVYADYRDIVKNFPYSKPARDATPTANSNEESLQTYGDGFGALAGQETFNVTGCTLTDDDATVTCASSANIRIGHTVSSTYDGGSTGIPSGAKVLSINTGTEGVDVTSFEMTGVFEGTTGSSKTITFANKVNYSNPLSHEFTFLGAKGYTGWEFGSIRGDAKDQSTYHIPTDESGKAEKEAYVADGVFGAFVPNLFFGFNLLDNETAFSNTEAQEGTVSFTSVAGVGPSNMTKEGVVRFEMDVNGTSNYNPFLNFVDLTGMYLVANFGTQIGKKSTRLDNRPFIHDATGYDVSWFASQNAEGTTNSITRLVGATSMDGTMVDPNHIIYVKEHRRNITGATVAHELLIDNVPLNNEGIVEFADNYRIMRPAETCLWKNSPEEIGINCLSSKTTKMPNNDKMYEDIPSLVLVNSSEEFLGSDVKASNYQNQGNTGINEGVMSMYVAIDPDARHAQYLHLGSDTDGDSDTHTVTAVLNNNQVVGTNTVFKTDLQEGDIILLDHQKCYVKSIEDNLNLTIAGKFVNDVALTDDSKAYLFNNPYLVLRDYIHLFNPTGNRNTFKSGSPYSMFLTDGISKQKITMGVDADYYDDRALCKLSIGKIENDMLGIVSFGETFVIKSNQKTRAENYTSAKIGSTVTIGEEVEDVINNLLSSEDISYDIKDDREYPYYISPNYQGIDIFSASNFAAKYKQKELRMDETGVSLIKQTNLLDYRPIELNYETNDFKIISVTRNKSTFDVYNEIIVYGNGIKALKRNRKSIDRLGKKTLEDVNMELTTQDDADSRAKSLLSAHSDGEDRFTVKMTTKGIDFLKAGDLVTLDFPAEGIDKGQYKVYEIRREMTGLIELEVGTYRKDLANRFAELSIQNKSNAASIRGSQFKSTTAPLDFFGSIKLKELRLVIRKISLSDSSAFTLGFQTLAARKLDFGTTMGPQETITTIITEEDFI